MLIRALVIVAGLAVLAGCAAPNRYIDPAADDGPVTMTMDYRDFEKAATHAVEDMLASGAVNNPSGGRYIMVVSGITNKTMQRIVTTKLTRKFGLALRRSGRVLTPTAVGWNGPEAKLI